MVIYYYHSCKNRIAYIDMYISMHMQKDTPKKSSQPSLLCHIFLSFQPVSFPASLIADFKSTSASSRALIERCAHFRPVHCIARETSSKRLPRKRIKPCCNSKHVTLELDILADRKWSHKKQSDLPGTPKDMGPPYGKRDPYYSHIFRDSYGSGMGKMPVSSWNRWKSVSMTTS